LWFSLSEVAVGEEKDGRTQELQPEEEEVREVLGFPG
jgi:hypothetical protein